MHSQLLSSIPPTTTTTLEAMDLDADLYGDVAGSVADEKLLESPTQISKAEVPVSEPVEKSSVAPAPPDHSTATSSASASQPSVPATLAQPVQQIPTYQDPTIYRDTSSGMQAGNERRFSALEHRGAVTSESTGEFFSQFGRVVDSTAVLDRETGRSKGFGFISLEDANVQQFLGFGHLEIDGVERFPQSPHHRPPLSHHAPSFHHTDYTRRVMLNGVRRSSRQAMNRLSELFPLIKSLKLNPAVVDTLAPRELQLQSIGFLRQFSPFDELNNLDPDFAALQQAFESGAARSTADAQEDDCVGHGHEEEDNSSLESSGEGSLERAVGTRCVVQISTQTPSSPALPNSKRKATSTSDQERPNAATKLRRIDPRSPLPPGVDPLPTGSTTATSRSVHLVWSATSGDGFHAFSAFPPGFNPQAPRFQPVRPLHLSSPEWRRMRKHQHRKWSLSQRVNKSTKVHVSPGEFNVVEDSRISKPAWMGLKASADLRIPIQDSILKPNTESAALLFKDITLVPYVPHLALAVGDSLGHLFLYCSRLTGDMIKDLLPQVNAVVPKFVSAITKPFGQNDMLLNSRGEHWFSIAGHDRNNKSVNHFHLAPPRCLFLTPLSDSCRHPVPAAESPGSHDPLPARFHSSKTNVSLSFLPTRFTIEHNTSAYGCEILKAHFPAIAKRYQDSINYMRLKYGIEAMFGLFFNFCLNAPRKGVKRVFCKPHVDWKNIAFGVCMIYVYGHFNHREKCWLVIWEAGIALEIPPGVFVFYPSSLFLHFNVDLSHLPIFTTQNGERPTADNSTPLYFCGCESHTGNQGWADADGRGSMVWFNQASMIQTSELGVATIQQARRMGLNTTCDTDSWVAQGVFPSIT
ncbi:hypothetical protein EV359DRAFT_85743 [Lentinula novae-zelandiae]|nr:hypothetical protein EV359DRAFT_85743 [Lentinula novae-zelandiae]